MKNKRGVGVGIRLKVDGNLSSCVSHLVRGLFLERLEDACAHIMGPVFAQGADARFLRGGSLLRHEPVERPHPAVHLMVLLLENTERASMGDKITRMIRQA